MCRGGIQSRAGHRPLADRPTLSGVPSSCRLRLLAPLVALLLASLALAACGGSGDEQSSAAEPSAAPVADFPRPNGRTIKELLAEAPKGPVLAPTQAVYEPGPNRFGFGLFDVSRRFVTDAQAVVYTADATGANVRGPFPAREESLKTAPPFLAQTTANDPDAAKSLYVGRVQLPAGKRATVLTLARVNGKLESGGPLTIPLSPKRQPPRAGEKAIEVDTPTAQSVGGDLAKIDTRVPPSPSLHQDNLADVLGKKPAILVFATPQLCQSRVCGPVVDITAQVQHEVGDGVAFIHQEIYKNNKIEDGFRPQVDAWRLPTEPWLFAIDKQGRIVERIEGAFSLDELRAAVKKAEAG